MFAEQQDIFSTFQIVLLSKPLEANLARSAVVTIFIFARGASARAVFFSVADDAAVKIRTLMKGLKVIP